MNIKTLNEQIYKLEKQLSAQTAEIARLREALKRYGKHHAQCTYYQAYANLMDDCCCGLKQALEGGGK